MLLDNTTDFNLLHPINIPPPTVVTLLGIVIEVREVQFQKAASPMLVTLLPIVTEVREEQPAKAAYPMLVTLSGMVIEVRDSQ